MHAPAFFQEGDQAIDRAGAKGIAADEKGVKAEDGPQPLVAKIFRNEAVDASVALEADEMAGDARHIGERAEGRVSELLEADAVDGFAVSHEAFEARNIPRIEARNFRPHRRFVSAHREDVAVVEANLVKGIDGAQVHIVCHAAAAERPQFFEQKGRCDNRGSGVEGEAILSMDGGSAPRSVELFENRDLVAPRAQSNGRGEAAESAPDHDRSGTGIQTGRADRALLKCQHNDTLSMSIKPIKRNRN